MEQKEFYQKITVRYKIFKVVVQDYDFLNLELGEIIKVKGEIKEISGNHIPNAFDYKKYFYNNLFLYEIKASSIIVKEKQLSIYYFNSLLNKYLCNYFENESLLIMKAFILGDTSEFSETFKNSLKTNGVIHLFALSGLHVSLLVNILTKLLGRFKNKNKIINCFLVIYLIITRFGVSICRAVFTHLLKRFFIYKNIDVNSLDCTSIVFIIFIMINPFFMYNNGFVLSFLATFIIILISDSIKTVSKIKSSLIITLVINCFSLPIIINMNNEFNILSPVINIVMVFLVETLILPLSLLVFVLPILNIGYTYIISAFIYISEMLAEISNKLGLVIVIKEMSVIFIIVYYFTVFLIVYSLNKKTKLKLISVFCYFIILISILININFKKNITITFLDLYIGEATLIEYKDEIILIDTGEGINNEVTSFLKSKGIRKLDYLIITHNHSDHNGEAKVILNSFSVTNIVLNTYDNSVLNNYDHVIKLKAGNVLKTKYLEFRCLSPGIKSTNENNNSLVLYVIIDNVSFLFTGDMEQEVESEIYNISVDILKVAHHGSTTSSSSMFLDKINPKYAVIMPGRSNSFSFPSEVILKRLKERGVVVFNVSECYSLEIQIKNNKCIFNPLKEIIY